VDKLDQLGAHALCQSGALASRHSSNLHQYLSSSASRALGHPYLASKTFGSACHWHPGRMDYQYWCSGLVDGTSSLCSHLPHSVNALSMRILIYPVAADGQGTFGPFPSAACLPIYLVDTHLHNERLVQGNDLPIA